MRCQRYKFTARGNPYLHTLDRYAGVPLVFTLAAARRRRSLPSAPRTIGVLNTSAIGDTILMSSAIADLQTAYPQASIVSFSGPANSEAAGLLDGVNARVTLSLANPLAAVRTLREYRLDLLFDFGPWPRINAVLCALAGAGFTVGFRTPGQYRHYAYDAAVEHRSDVHELENYRGLVRTIGLEAWHLPSVKCSAPAPVTIPGERFLVFHLWPGGTQASLKEWPLERWVRLAHSLVVRGYRIVLTGAPGQFIANETLIAKLGPSLRSHLHNSAGLSLDATASILAKARLVVSVNTGIMHLAAAVGAWLIALHGPTSVRRWGPVGPRTIALESPCRGCGYLDLGFEFDRQPRHCMSAISYRMVSEACAQVLSN